MGGAERAERRRKQQAQARGAVPVSGSSTDSTDRRRVFTAVAVVLVLALAVVGGILWQRARSTPPSLQPQQVSSSYPVQLDGGVVVAGESTAKVTIDIYEDPICPACGAFEQRDAERLEQALDAGTIRVRYHLLNMLDDASNPPGYSLDAAAAALCAVPAGAFPSYHSSLFARQPREGGRGYSVDQLIELGHSVGITSSDFDTCVRDGVHKDAVRAQLSAATNDPALRRSGPRGAYFGTPTVVVGGTLVDWSNESWLDDAIRAVG